MSDYDPQNPLAGASTCPHCGGLAKVSPHPELRYVCNICGAPRVEAKGITLSGREKPALEKARNARRERLLWKIGAVVGGASAAFIFVVSLIVFLAASAASWPLFGLAFGVPWLLLAILGARNASGKTAEVETALAEAWQSAARDVVLAHDKGISSRELAERLGIDENAAENLIAQLSVDDMLRSRLSDDGRLVIAPVEGLRIEAGPAAPIVDPLEEKFAALEAAEAEAEEAAATKKKTF